MVIVISIIIMIIINIPMGSDIPVDFLYVIFHLKFVLLTISYLYIVIVSDLYREANGMPNWRDKIG